MSYSPDLSILAFESESFPETEIVATGGVGADADLVTVRFGMLQVKFGVSRKEDWMRK